MKEPTEEQEGKVWKWCGVKPEKVYEQTCLQQGAYYLKFPPIDLNNLFKWAMPKLDEEYAYVLMQDSMVGEKEKFWSCEIYKSCLLSWQTGERIASIDAKDPALALFWAIYKVMEAIPSKE